MSTLPEERGNQSSRCPLCGSERAADPLPKTHCPGCGCLLWFRKRTVDDIVVLDIRADRTPEIADAGRLYKSLENSGTAPRIIVNLSQVSFVPSRLLATLVALLQEVMEVNGRVVLCSPHPSLHETLDRTRLSPLFDAFDNEADALRSLR